MSRRRAVLVGGGLYVSDECIHGFENGMCAICNPKPAPESTTTRSAPRVRAATLSRSSTTPQRSGTRIAGSKAPVASVLDQRVFHIPRIRNLAGILDAGALLANAETQGGMSPAAARAERSDVLVDGVRSTTLDSYVPFFLSPDATLWQALRAGARHPRLDVEAVSAGS